MTARLLLHLPAPSNAAAVARFYAENVEHFARWDPPRSPAFTTEPFWQRRLVEYANDEAAGTAVRFFLRRLPSIEHPSLSSTTATAGSSDPGDASIEAVAANAIEAANAANALPDDAAVIGSVNFNNICRGPFLSCSLGYAVDHRWEGQGIMREALREAVRYTFEDQGLHRIAAGYLPINERSGQLLRRLGFAPEGYARDYLFINGAWRDHVLTALVNPSAPEPGA